MTEHFNARTAHHPHSKISHKANHMAQIRGHPSIKNQTAIFAIVNVTVINNGTINMSK